MCRGPTTSVHGPQKIVILMVEPVQVASRNSSCGRDRGTSVWHQPRRNYQIKYKQEVAPNAGC